MYISVQDKFEDTKGEIEGQTIQFPKRKMTTGQIMIYNTNDCATRTH